MLKTHGSRDSTEPTLEKRLFERVAGYQQAVLLLAGFSYAFGYASRALHAYENNLGALPGVRFEYLVAGSLLLIPPIALSLFLWRVWRSAKRLSEWAAEDPQRKDRVPHALSAGLLLGTVMLLFPYPARTVGIFFVGGCFLYLLTYLAAAGESAATPEPTESASVGRRRKVSRWLGNAALYLWSAAVALWISLLLVGAFALAILYGAIALKHVPLEFGGVNPKCGVFDLSLEQLSAELRGLIVSPDEHLDQSSKVVRSRRLEVFSTSEPWLVRLPSPEAGVPPRSIRLDGKTVLSVEWCR